MSRKNQNAKERKFKSQQHYAIVLLFLLFNSRPNGHLLVYNGHPPVKLHELRKVNTLFRAFRAFSSLCFEPLESIRALVSIATLSPTVMCFITQTTSLNYNEKNSVSQTMS